MMTTTAAMCVQRGTGLGGTLLHSTCMKKVSKICHNEYFTLWQYSPSVVPSDWLNEAIAWYFLFVWLGLS